MDENNLFVVNRKKTPGEALIPILKQIESVETVLREFSKTQSVLISDIIKSLTALADSYEKASKVSKK